MKVGTATLKLNKLGRDNAKGKAAKKGQKKGKKSGKTRAVVGEAMEERRGKDVRNGGSIDHDRSNLNEYWVCDEIVEWAKDRGVSPTSADTIVDWCEERIEEYSENVFRPKVGRGVAEDAIQMIGLIVKPRARVIADWSPERTKEFFQLSGDYFDNALGGKRNLVCVARHFDEGFEDESTHVFYDGEHEHRFYMPWTEDGRLSAKEVHGPSLWKKLNREYAEYMHEHGFPEIEATEILDYDEIVKLDQQIAEAEQAGDIETVEAKKAEREQMRKEAYEVRQQHREERDGLAPGAPAASYRALKETQNARDKAQAETKQAEAKTAAALEVQEKLASEEDGVIITADGVEVPTLGGLKRMRQEVINDGFLQVEDAQQEAAELVADARRAADEFAFEVAVRQHEMQADMNRAHDELDTVRNEMSQIKRETATVSQSMLDKAKADAARIREDAKVDAERIHEDERVELERRGAALDKREAEQDERAAAQAKITVEQDERAAAQDEREAEQAGREVALKDFADKLTAIDDESAGFIQYVTEATSNKENMDAMFYAKAPSGKSVDDGVAEQEPDLGRRPGLRIFVMNMAARFVAALKSRWLRDRERAIENAKQEYEDAWLKLTGKDKERQLTIEVRNTPDASSGLNSMHGKPVSAPSVAPRSGGEQYELGS